MCVGESPPQDHPHVYINMGEADTILCPYCATRFRFDPRLTPLAARVSKWHFSEERAGKGYVGIWNVESPSQMRRTSLKKIGWSRKALVPRGAKNLCTLGIALNTWGVVDASAAGD
jgi:hypothetical protein